MCKWTGYLTAGLLFSGIVCGGACAQTVQERIHTFTATQDPDDLRAALLALKALLWEGPGKTKAQGGTQRSVRKLDAAHEEELAPWFDFYAALDNVEAQMRSWKMPRPLLSGPQPDPVMTAKEQMAYENALLTDADARKYSTTMAQLRAIRMDASSFFWMWSSGVLRDDPKLLAQAEMEALATNCLPVRATWIREVLSEPKGAFDPSDQDIANEKPVKRSYREGFPQYAAFKNANPSNTHDVTVRVPTRLLVSHENGRDTLRFDPASFETVTLKVGYEMFTGAELDQITKAPG